MLDADEAGYRATREIVDRLIGEVFIKVVRLPEGCQPDSLPERKIKELLSVK